MNKLKAFCKLFKPYNPLAKTHDVTATDSLNFVSSAVLLIITVVSFVLWTFPVNFVLRIFIMAAIIYLTTNYIHNKYPHE